MRTFLLCFLLSLSFAPTGFSAPEPDAKETARRFIKAIRDQDANAALKCVFVPPESAARAKAKIEGMIRLSKTIRTEPQAQEFREIGTVAVVIVKDGVPNDRGKPDYDTVFFVKRAGEWRMVINSLIRTNREDPITAEERATMAELMKWADAKRAELER